MDATEIIAKMSPLQLPAGDYCCFGSSTMALLGIREAKDVDVLALPVLCAWFKIHGWKEKIISAGNPPKPTPVFYNPQYPDVDVFRTWDYVGFNRTPAEIIASAQEGDGVSFAHLDDVIA